jgi:hypothetical protein
VHFDPKLRDQVVARYKALNVPTYWAGINAILTPQFGSNGQLQSVEISYPAAVAQQYLAYSSMYDKSLGPTRKVSKRPKASEKPAVR